MWDDGFVNEPYMRYKYNCYYKHWLIGQLNNNLDSDIVNDIQRNKHVLQSYQREFKIPDINSYTNKFGNDEYYIDPNGIIFVKSIPTKYPVHKKDRKMKLLYSKNPVLKCFDIVFYYNNDNDHYYTIDRRNSKIDNVKFIKQEYKITGDTKTCMEITLIDPILISY